MKLSDFSKLKKLMNMTLSGADQERLVAIDRANEIIKNSNTTWDRVLDRVIKVEVEIESFEDAGTGPDKVDRATKRREIDEAFATILATDPRGEFADFIASLKQQWDDKGRLTGPQLEALFNAKRRRERV